MSASCLALPTGKAGQVRWASVLDFLIERLPGISSETWAMRMARGEVLDDDGRPLAPTAPYPGGSRLYYYRDIDTEPVIPFSESVLFADDHLVVVDKPHFLPVTPSGRYVQQTLLVRLKQRLGLEDLSPIHRIDRETAGLVLFSVRAQDRGAYQALFRDRAVDKCYEAIAPTGAPGELPVVRRSRIVEDAGAFFRMREVEGEPNSETRIEARESHGAWTRYALEPHTGKRHQLRVHLNALGRPIRGDQFYPAVLRGPDVAEDFSTPLCLLAQAIAFRDPVTGQPRRFETGRQLTLVAGASA